MRVQKTHPRLLPAGARASGGHPCFGPRPGEPRRRLFAGDSGGRGDSRSARRCSAQVVAGNFAGAILANFGADVIKIESPKGDQLRSLRVRDDVGTSLWWRCHNRNKRCVTVDLHKDAGRDILRRLAQKSDVLIENFRPGVMEGWKLGPGDLPPSLVYARISGYGQTGPLGE